MTGADLELLARERFGESASLDKVQDARNTYCLSWSFWSHVDEGCVMEQRVVGDSFANIWAEAKRR